MIARRSIAFLITNQYQIHHYSPIARHLADVTFVIEHRDEDLGVDEGFVAARVPNARFEHVAYRDLGLLDGRFELIVCQTPVLPYRLLERTLVVAQQYSMAKEAYQYGSWRSLAAHNLMYGAYSVEKVAGFAAASEIGNPCFDDLLSAGMPARPGPSSVRRVLYLPTYGALSSIDVAVAHLSAFGDEITIKPHHLDRRRLPSLTLPPGCVVVGADEPPAELIHRHDLVVSDHSGAAYDAVIARRPLVLVDVRGRARDERARLGPGEGEYPLIGPMSGRWRPGDDPSEAIAAAVRLLPHDEAYHEFVTRHLSRPGSAGAAAAEAITDLLSAGPMVHFARDRVAERERELLLRQEELGREVRRLRRRVTKLQNRREQAAATMTGPTSAFVRKTIAAAPRLARGIVAFRQRLASGPADTGEGPAATPNPRLTASDERHGLIEALVEAGVDLRAAPVRGRLVAAIRDEQRLDLVRALRILHQGRPTLACSLGIDAQFAEIESVLEIDDDLMRRATTVRVGETTDVPLDERLEIDIVERRAVDGRHLACDTAAARYDWSTDFQRAGQAPVWNGRHSTLWPGHAVQTIDAVYTWFAPERDRRTTGTTPSDGTYDWLRYSLRSLWCNAPFFRRIVVITDGRVPPWLDIDHPAIMAVDIQGISRGANSMPSLDPDLDRIEDLAEHIVVVDSSHFLSHELTIGDFFTEAGLPIVRLSTTRRVGEQPTADEPTELERHAVRANTLVHEQYGRRIDRLPSAAPPALRRSELRELVERFGGSTATERSAAFPIGTGFGAAQVLAQYWGLAAGRAVEGTSEDIFEVDVGSSDDLALLDVARRRRPTILHLEETGRDQVARDEQATRIDRFLGTMFPRASPFELDRTNGARATDEPRQLFDS